MLYTFSQGDYPEHLLTQYLAQMSAQDALLLWQDGVLLAIKYPQLLAQTNAHCYALENDILARNLTALLPSNTKVRCISLTEWVQITEQYFPQFAL